ncbi:MAG: rhodanese-like domain-containing protein [Deltaproteobacteria bacterium]|nr:rhodanese-like domain-containing protein [Deltaproteobacteria bacterium]
MSINKTMIQAIILAVASSVAGLAFNAVRPDGIPFVAPDRVNVRVDFEDTSGPVDLAGAKRLFDEGAAFLDARTEEEFARGHIKGAMNVPYHKADEMEEKILMSVAVDATIVAYCSGADCHASDLLARALEDMGYEKVRVFFAGWPAWEAAGYPSGKDENAAPAPLFSPMGTGE